MQLGKNIRYRVKQTSKGPIRLAFGGGGEVVEAKNLRTKKTHTPEEFEEERRKMNMKGAMKAMRKHR